MPDRTVVDAVEVQVRRLLADGVDGVRQGLVGLGWSPGPGIDGSVIDAVWTHDAVDGRARAQTGEQAGDYYVGLIANVADDRAADALRDRLRDRIAAPLGAAGFGTLTHDDMSTMWSDGRAVVELSLLREIRHDTHTVPAAVQFAVQPQRAFLAGLDQSAPARDSSSRRNEASRPGLD